MLLPDNLKRIRKYRNLLFPNQPNGSDRFPLDLIPLDISQITVIIIT